MELITKNHLNISYKILIIVFALLTILQCNSVYDSNFFGELLINGLWQLVLFIICIYVCRSNTITNFYLNKLVIFLFCYIVVVASLLTFYYIYSPFTLFYVLLLLIDPVFIMIWIAKSTNIRNYFFKILEDIVILLAIISLFFWILELNGLSPNMSIIIKWGGQPHPLSGFDYIQFLPQGGNFSFLGKSLMRNTGIFVEAPMFSYVLSMALLIELFIRSHVSKYRIAILFIAIFSTTSTTGLIVALLAISYYMIISLKSIYKYLIIFLIPIIFILEKFIFLNKVNAVGSSYGERAYEWHIDIIDWQQHLIIGNGLPSIGSSGASHSFGAVGLSSGLMATLAYGGILLLMFYVLPSLCSLFVTKRIFGLSLLSFLLFILTVVIHSYLYIIILSYLWVSFILKQYMYNDNKDIIKKGLNNE